MIRRTPLGLAVVMRAVAPLEEAEALQGGERAGDGIGDAFLEPADRPGAHAAENLALLPRFPEDAIQLPLPPEGEHVLRVPPADVDDILLHHEGAEIGRRRIEQDEVAGPARKLGKGGIEVDDIALRIAARRRHEEDLRGHLSRQVEDVAIQQQSIRLHREAASPHRNDLSRQRTPLRIGYRLIAVIDWWQ